MNLHHMKGIQITKLTPAVQIIEKAANCIALVGPANNETTNNIVKKPIAVLVNLLIVYYQM